VQLAAAEHVERVGRRRLLDAQRDVRLQLLEQAVAQVAGGDVLPSLPANGPLFDMNCIFTVGSSISSSGRSSGARSR
jgi:hypothetical protein